MRGMLRRSRGAAIGLGLAAGLTLPIAVTSASPGYAAQKPTANGWQVVTVTGVLPASGTVNGCPYGDVCMYTDSGWANGQPSSNDGRNGKYSQGCYNLVSEYGHRYILNNQYGGWKVSLYQKYGCTDPPLTTSPPAPPYSWWQGDIGPINSIYLFG